MCNKSHGHRGNRWRWGWSSRCRHLGDGGGPWGLINHLTEALGQQLQDEVYHCSIDEHLQWICPEGWLTWHDWVIDFDHWGLWLLIQAGDVVALVMFARDVGQLVENSETVTEWRGQRGIRSRVQCLP